ncbi:hypothetical protein [Dolichospermum heterosporum]|uniref:Uncharacterized protein n=1 Tax=Dolichospermum heterosporum TAC447 TaxID=747523 RepID=A0ABY5M2D8_9CYAN|nr:hypothetical protein [Dolichospermum heterosporum]UUO18085.1 hypothetical protein NG743_01335 [Dolichospermum heterosporum TAC447]
MDRQRGSHIIMVREEPRTTRGSREGWEPRLFRARGKAYPCGFNRFQYSRS